MEQYVWFTSAHVQLHGHIFACSSTLLRVPRSMQPKLSSVPWHPCFDFINPPCSTKPSYSSLENMDDSRSGTRRVEYGLGIL